MSVGIIQRFPPEGSLTWARWPGPSYKSLSAVLRKLLVYLREEGWGRPAPSSGSPAGSLPPEMSKVSSSGRRSQELPAMHTDSGWWEILSLPHGGC